jgi:hypothetical protein
MIYTPLWRDRQWLTMAISCALTVLGLMAWAELGIRLLP